MTKKKVVIVGAGPAGLSAAYELLNRAGKDFDVTVIEKLEDFGGISRTVHFKGNKMDIGGHRFHDRIPLVKEWWEKMMPVQGALAIDDIILGREGYIEKNGPDPNKNDNVLLKRNRLCRIFFKKKFFDYPVTLSFGTIKSMGPLVTILAGFSFLKSRIYKRKVSSLEDYYINHFGKKLYTMFFEDYTKNLWGIHPRDISPKYGMQRVNDEISIKKMILQLFSNKKHDSEQKADTFSYPKLGPGQMWETVADRVRGLGGRFIMGAEVIGIKKDGNNKIVSAEYKKGKITKKIRCDYLVSSMPIKDLAQAMNGVPEEIRRITDELLYRDYIMAGILCKKLALKNKTTISTIGDIIPDQWIYIHDKNVRMGRLQIFNNWSPYLLKDYENTVWVGLEYFCNENDDIWKMKRKDFLNIAIGEMVDLGIVDSKKDVIDGCVVRVEKAYPAYFGGYDYFDRVKEYLDKIQNLFCVGRNGRHCYSDLDYVVCSSFEAVENIINGAKGKENVWEPQKLSRYEEKVD